MTSQVPGDAPVAITPPGDTSATAGRRRSRRRWWTAIGVALVLELIVAGAVLVAVTRDDGGTGDGPAEYTYVVPLGTYQRIQAGEDVFVIPSQLQLRLGDRIVIVNEDDRDHTIGPFSVRAGETIGHTFREPGDYTGICTVDPKGSIEIHVI